MLSPFLQQQHLKAKPGLVRCEQPSIDTGRNFQAAEIELCTRVALFQTFVLSIFEFNFGALVSIKESDVQYVRTALRYMYQALLKGLKPREVIVSLSWPVLLSTYQIQTPSCTRHASDTWVNWFAIRLSLCGRWYKPNKPGFPNCRASLRWLFEQISSAISLGRPHDSWSDWLEVILRRPQVWKGWIKRAVQHYTQQQYKHYMLRQAHSDIGEQLDQMGCSLPSDAWGQKVLQGRKRPTQHACLQCQRFFESRTAWASHAFKQHGRYNAARLVTFGTRCHVCLSEYWTFARLYRHLKQSHACRLTLWNHGMRLEQPDPGLGSRVRKKESAELNFDVNLLERLCGCLLVVNDSELDGLCMNQVTMPLDAVRSIAQDSVLEYCLVASTLDMWLDDIPHFASDLSEGWQKTLQHFCQVCRSKFSASWAMGADSNRVTDTSDADAVWRTKLTDPAARHDQASWGQPNIERPFWRILFAIHLFSGRRRPGDIQQWIEGMRGIAGAIIVAVSADVISGPTADFGVRANRDRWIELCLAGYVVARLVKAGQKQGLHGQQAFLFDQFAAWRRYWGWMAWHCASCAKC